MLNSLVIYHVLTSQHAVFLVLPVVHRMNAQHNVLLVLRHRMRLPKNHLLRNSWMHFKTLKTRTPGLLYAFPTLLNVH
jgi:hypothetical protein